MTEIAAELSFRLCTAADLPSLEWSGEFSEHRSIFAAAYQAQLRGGNLMLLAFIDGALVGQVFLDLERERERGAALIWALRVVAPLRGRGVGRALVREAELMAQARGYPAVRLGVEKSAPELLYFYHALGYRVIGESAYPVPYITPVGAPASFPINEWVLQKPIGEVVQRTSASSGRPLGIRWTIGDVSARGFEALRLSIWGAHRVFGPAARLAVCVNSITVDRARRLVGAVPPGVLWLNATSTLPDLARTRVAAGLAEGAAWKLSPLRVFPHRHELSLDNDCILWGMPAAVDEWLNGDDPDATLLAEDVAAGFGRFADLCGPEPRNAGMRGLPPWWSFRRKLAETLALRDGMLSSGLDEQGLQVATLQRYSQPKVVRLDDVTICSPFPPHLSHLGRCGAHFVGVNARRLPWSSGQRPASERLEEHWLRHREELYARVGRQPPPARLRAGIARAASEPRRFGPEGVRE